MTRRVLVIGAGPAGLVSAKTLLHFPPQLGDGDDDREPAFDPIVLEQANKLGGTL